MLRLSKWKLPALLALLGAGGMSLAAIAQRRQPEIPENEAIAPLTSEIPVVGVGYRQGLFWRTYDRVAQSIDHKLGWDRLPRPFGLFVLFGLRNILRQRNLYDTTAIPSMHAPHAGPLDARYLAARTLDGTYNDLQHPSMGMAGSRFGRNVPLKYTYPEREPAILTPNPRTISRELLTREKFQAATTLNCLAAAWIQFMIRDWFSHNKSKDNPWKIEVSQDDPWQQKPMLIMPIEHDPTREPASDGLPPTSLNSETHWWDASQLYGGSDPNVQKKVRLGQGGKLIIGADGLLKVPTDPQLDPRRVPGWWIGLEMMQTLFIREHNAICDRLQAEYPTWSDDEIFERARLITAALLAKIHTVEWTPAILSHPTTQAALRANWWGLEMERFNRVFGRLSNSEVISGIPGSATDHYGVPYSLTEEFVAVYKMHPLIRDDYNFRSATDGKSIQQNTLNEITGPQAQTLAQKIPMADLFYSFGTLHPGAIVLHNYPRFMQDFERPDNGVHMDLAATDIMRVREMGVPRYNKFRELLHLSPAKTFEDITDQPEWAEEMRRVYNNDVEQVDLMIGLFAERRPQGFAFSDTAFRIFILMASRRLNSDRFFTTDFTPQTYTPVGMDWIKNNTMITVLLRHYPELHASLHRIENAFVPWDEIGED